ncbi:uncharacterized protein LOC131331023 [Rhododendron vialii]|uniref:uncharacterized protein LOC131331023 n=1 Tax=Rhododendron vialii TaxID=182163 RepID=UPI00265EC621|nr:uncharacterized protein LOC131331023 [Rhododendron vialii]
MQIRELPTEYILQRWTKTAKAGRVMDDLGSDVREICNSSLLVRRQGLFQLACTVIDEAILNEEESEVVREALESSQKKIALMRSARKDGSPSSIQLASTSRIQVPSFLRSQHSLKEPLQVRAKGCGKRLKGGKEKAIKKMRKCNGCGLTGQSYDKRNCPKLINMSSQDVRLSGAEDDDDDDDDDVDDEYERLNDIVGNVSYVAPEILHSVWLYCLSSVACFSCGLQ